MDTCVWTRRTFHLLTASFMFIYLMIILICLKYNQFLRLGFFIPNPRAAIQKPYIFSALTCPESTSHNSITPIKGTRYLMVSAFEKDEANGQINIITIMNRTHYEPFTCIFCCVKHGLTISPVSLDKHREDFGFPFITTDASCSIESTCNATHVTISRPQDLLETRSHMYLPIHKYIMHKSEFDVDFTLCISCLFRSYNNVLQFVQTIETYKLLGVERVVIYNTSCGPDLRKVLQIYKEEGILETIPWPIHHFLQPSEGWRYDLHPGEVHYYGQQATLNDCIHRNRQRSRYVLLNDADEIIMPYRHVLLRQLMEELQERRPSAATFIFQTHVFSKNMVSGSARFDLPEWRHVPGVNILRHVHREPIRWFVNNPSKMIVNPRKVTETSVHRVTKSSGGTFWVPNNLAIVLHTAKPEQPGLPLRKLIMDTKIWEFAERLIPNVNRVLQKSGLLN